jgi:hypothetical protein
MKNKSNSGRRLTRFQYYLTVPDFCTAYRAVVRFSKAKHDFVVVKPPEVFNGCWQSSNRYPQMEEFIANIDCGTVKKVSLLQAAAAINADIVLFAPTQSSRLATKAFNKSKQ